VGVPEGELVCDALAEARLVGEEPDACVWVFGEVVVGEECGEEGCCSVCDGADGGWCACGCGLEPHFRRGVVECVLKAWGWLLFFLFQGWLRFR